MSLLNCFVSVCLVLMQQDDVLFLLRQNTEYGDGLYGMPGGGMLENERLTQAVVRIAKVQLGITIQEEDLELTTIVHIPSVIHQPEEIAFYFTAKHYEGVIANVRPNKCKELRFFPLTALPQNLLDVQATQNMKEKRMLAP